MHKDNHNSPLAISYAQALLELANDRDTAESIAGELRDIRQIVDTNPTFGLFLADPAVGHEERERILRSIFGGRVSKLMLDFLLLLNQKGRIGSLAAIAGAYDDLLDEQHGKVEVDVTVASRLSPDQLEEVRRRVSGALKRDAVVHQYVDDSIIGGLILRVQDQLIDGSVRGQLAQMRQRLLSARVR